MDDKLTDEVASKTFTVNKFLGAILLFLVVGFLINTFILYNQKQETQIILEQKGETNKQILELIKEQRDQNKILLDKMSNLELKFDSLQKSGK